MNLKFTATETAECKDFLCILDNKTPCSIDVFIGKYPSVSNEELEKYQVAYRGEIKTYKEWLDEYSAFCNSFKMYPTQNLPVETFIIDKDYRNAAYFARKASECLQFARFFTIKSALKLSPNYNLPWYQGYVPQYAFRCIYFGTATTWFSNCFDHILQVIYWGKKLYKQIKNYSEDLTDNEIAKKCTYNTMKNLLKKQQFDDINKKIESCRTAIDGVVEYSNAIKHRGGIDYKYLEPKSPIEIYYSTENKMTPTPEDRLLPFKPEVSIDIDEKYTELLKANEALLNCLEEMLKLVDFDSQTIHF